MLKTGLIFLIFCTLIFQAFCQSENEVEDGIKMLLFSSIESDGGGATKGTLREWIEVAKNHYDYLNYEKTSKIILYKPEKSDSIMGEYQIRMYKIFSENSENQSRYLIWYKDFTSEVWLRSAGYVENDLHLLFKYFRKQKFSKSEVKGMIEEWKAADEMFNELNWDCLFKAYLKGNIKYKYDCFKSVFYIRAIDISIGFDPVTDKELNSTFSRMPLYGGFN